MERETRDVGERQTTTDQPPLTAEGSRKKSRAIMVALDESDISLYALKWALEYLFNNSPGRVTGEDPGQDMITVVHAIEPFERYMFPADPSMYTSASMVASVRKSQQQNASHLLARAFQICLEKNVRAETRILEGDPKEMICQAVEQMHIDLLVVGSRGLGAIKRAFLGSTSDYCAHHAKCPILIVKPPHK